MARNSLSEPEALELAVKVQHVPVALVARELSRMAEIRYVASCVGPYDLITLHNNIYYFATAERTALFTGLAGKLTETGAICVVSMMAGTTALTRPPEAFSSAASTSVSMMTPALATA